MAGSRGNGTCTRTFSLVPPRASQLLGLLPHGSAHGVCTTRICRWFACTQIANRKECEWRVFVKRPRWRRGAARTLSDSGAISDGIRSLVTGCGQHETPRASSCCAGASAQRARARTVPDAGGAHGVCYGGAVARPGPTTAVIGQRWGATNATNALV